MKKVKDYLTSEVIGHYIPLSLRGKLYLGVCPFHSDTKPSMTVNDKKGTFRCSACKASGNSLDFVKKYKNISAPEAEMEIFEALKPKSSYLEVYSKHLKSVKRTSIKKVTEPKGSCLVAGLDIMEPLETNVAKHWNLHICVGNKETHDHYLLSYKQALQLKKTIDSFIALYEKEFK